MEEGLTASAVPATAPPVSAQKSPPHNTAAVGSPERDYLETQLLPSDEDQDRDPEHKNEAEPEPEPEQRESKVLTEDLKKKIIKQVEYYFSDENLPTDKYMISLLKKNREGFVPIGLIASFKKMKRLTRNHSFLVSALRESSFLVVSSDGRKVKRLHPFQLPEVKDPKFYTILVENLPEDHSVENIQRIFGEIGNSIKHIRICDPYAGVISKGGKADKFFSNKLHALVEFETIQAAEKAVATLNNEQDWRIGMRVKLIKNMGKYVQRKPVWKGPDSEKSPAGQSSDQPGEGEKHVAIEHHENTPEEAVGDNSKEKNGRRGRNPGRTAKQKYRGLSGQCSGQGHGTTKTNHGVEFSKPPPGPRMPDGTRGFTMGRGRPTVSNQS